MTPIELRQSYSFPGQPRNIRVIRRSDLASLHIWDNFNIKIQDTNDTFCGFSFGEKTIIEILQYHKNLCEIQSNQNNTYADVIQIDSLNNPQQMLIHDTLKKLQIQFQEHEESSGNYVPGSMHVIFINLSDLWNIPSLTKFTDTYQNIFNISANLPSHPIRLFYTNFYNVHRPNFSQHPFINTDFDTYFQYIKLFNDIACNLNEYNNIHNAIITTDYIINNYNWLHPDNLSRNNSQQQSRNPSVPSTVSPLTQPSIIVSQLSEIVFDIKESISDSQYIELMNKLSLLNSHFQS